MIVELYEADAQRGENHDDEPGYEPQVL